VLFCRSCLPVILNQIFPDAVRREYRRGDKGLGHLTVARGVGGEFYARTEHTAGWARLPPWAESLVLEAEKVAAGH
jgi:hypothetical protein